MASSMKQKTFQTDEKVSCRIDDLPIFLTQSFDCCSRLASSESIFLFLQFFFSWRKLYLISLFFCSLVIQIRIFRWNHSLNNFRLLRFVNIGLFIDGKHRAKYFSHETATSSSISRIYIFLWDIFFNNFHLVHQHFFSLEHFFLFFLSDFHTFELDFSFSILSIESFSVFWCKLSPNVWLFLMLFPILWMQITVNKFPMCYKRRE